MFLTYFTNLKANLFSMNAVNNTGGCNSQVQTELSLGQSVVFGAQLYATYGIFFFWGGPCPKYR